MERKAYLFVLNTMADWEPAFLTAEINTGRFFKKEAPRYVVKTVSLSKSPVVTMGGVTITPDLSLDEMKADKNDIFILPGGETWFEPEYSPVMDKVKELLSTGILVAAICGATMALAQAGILDNIPHTSNDLGALNAMCPNYKGKDYYRNEPAVISGNLVTASGAAPLELAKEVLGYLGVLSPEALDAWYNLHKTNGATYFYALMEAVSKDQGVMIQG